MRPLLYGGSKRKVEHAAQAGRNGGSELSFANCFSSIGRDMSRTTAFVRAPGRMKGTFSTALPSHQLRAPF